MAQGLKKKNPLAKFPSLGWQDSVKKDMATHSSILAWEIPWTEEPGGLRAVGSQRVGHDWSGLSMHILDSRIYLFRIQRVPFAEAKTNFYFYCNKEDLKITLLIYAYEILRKKRNHFCGNDYYWNQSHC